MTYEEKLDLVLQAINEAIKYKRKSQKSFKLLLTKDNSLNSINLNEVHDILLKLQDDEQVLKVIEIPKEIKDGWELDVNNINYFLLQASDEFTIWYERYIFENMHKISHLDWINLLKIYDVSMDINQELQIAKSTVVYIPSLPQVVKFTNLFPGDSVGSRKTYQGYRMQGVDYLKKQGVISEYRYIDSADFGYGEIELNVRLIEFRDMLSRLSSEYKRRYIKYNKDHKNNVPKATDKTSKSTYFDIKRNELNIEERKVKFKKDSFRAKLLELLLKDDKSRKEEWSCDKVVETIEGITDLDLLKEKQKKFYPACDGISKFIAQKTGINDLLLYTKSTVQLNPKYL